MKQIDYLKLVATGRKATHFERPSDADEALTGAIGFMFLCSFFVTFAAVFLSSFLGSDLDLDAVGMALLPTIVPGIAYFVAGIFIGGAPKIVRVCIAAAALVTAATLILLGMAGDLGVWYLYLPAFLFATVTAIGAVRQL